MKSFGRVATIGCLTLVAATNPAEPKLAPSFPAVEENFNPDMSATFGQYSRADWVDCVEEPHGYAQVVLPPSDGKSVVGVVGEMVMDSTGADMPVFADGATIEQQGDKFTVTPMWSDPVTVSANTVTRVNLLGDNWIRIGMTTFFDDQRIAMGLSCSDQPS